MNIRNNTKEGDHIGCMHGCLILIIPTLTYSLHLCGNLRSINVQILPKTSSARLMGSFFQSSPDGLKVQSGPKTTVLRMRQQDAKVDTKAMALELYLVL